MPNDKCRCGRPLRHSVMRTSSISSACCLFTRPLANTYSAYGKCPCGSTALNTQTRTCIDRDGDGKWCAGAVARPLTVTLTPSTHTPSPSGKWCDGPSSRSCKSKPCPITTTTEPAKWGPWGACSKACGPGSQTRTCSRKGQCTGPSKQGCVTRACCPRTCNVGFGAKSCDQMYNLYAGSPNPDPNAKPNRPPNPNPNPTLTLPLPLTLT